MKFKKILFILPLILGYLIFNFYSEYSTNRNYEEAVAARAKRKMVKTESAIERANWEFMMLRDPQTNEIPRGIFAMGQDFAKLPQEK